MFYYALRDFAKQQTETYVYQEAHELEDNKKKNLRDEIAELVQRIDSVEILATIVEFIRGIL